MKWIKLFENFENISSDIKDILIDMMDDNPNSINRDSSNVSINCIQKEENKNRLIIRIIVNNGSIKTSKYKEDFLRLDRYLQKKGYTFSSFTFKNVTDSTRNMIYPKMLGIKGEKLFNHLLNLDSTNNINIYYK